MAAAANDVIYYGLIFRLPSERVSQRATEPRGSEWEARKEEGAADIWRWSAVHRLARCSAVGLIYGWEGGRTSVGRLVGLVASAL